jgi:hypothetical protein
MPTALNWPATGVINSKVYVVGGYTGGPATTLNQIYNPATDTWSTGAPIPAATAQAAGAVVGTTLYVIGYHVGTLTQKEIVVGISIPNTARKRHNVCLS